MARTDKVTFDERLIGLEFASLIVTTMISLHEVICVDHPILLKRTSDVGDTATFSCPSSSVEPHVDWNIQLYNASAESPSKFTKLTTDGIVKHGYKHRFTVQRGDGGNWLLTIHDVKQRDVGIYECVKSSGQPLAVFHLQVPYFRVEVYEGQKATLECRTTLEFHVVWRYSRTFREERSFVYSQGRVLARDRTRFRVHPKHRNYDLVIHNTSLSDSGIFTCTEDGGFGPGEVCWSLTALEKTKNPAGVEFEDDQPQRHHHRLPNENQPMILAVSDLRLNGSRCTSNIFLVVVLLLCCVFCT